MAEFTSILICGGSLAGTACAIRLKELGHEPVIVEKSTFPRKKLCGEFLGPDAILFLKKLSVWESVQAEAYGPVEHIEIYSPSGRQLTIQARWIRKEIPYGMAIPREKLDTILYRHTRELGVCILEKRTVRGYKNIDYNGILVDIETRNANNQSIPDQVLCEILIDGLGRNSRLSETTPATQNTAKHIGSKKGNHTFQKVGLQCHIKHAEPNPSKNLRMFLFKGGYGGIQPISRHSSNLCMLVDDRLAQYRQQEFQDFLNRSIKQNPVAKTCLDAVELDGSILSTANLNLDLQDAPLRRLIRIGDALITMEPFTGFGMAHALQTGYLAAECIHEGLAKKQSYSRIKADYYHRYQKTFGGHLKWIRCVRPVLESSQLQETLWDFCPPVLPFLANVYR